MFKVVQILFGALLTAATAWSLGMLLFRRLSLTFSRDEEFLYAFITGSALLSSCVFVLTAAHLAYVWVFGILAAAVIGLGIRRRAYVRSEQLLPPLPFFWKWLFWICFVVYGSLYLM